MDILYLVLGLGFFALSAWLVGALHRLRDDNGKGGSI